MSRMSSSRCFSNCTSRRCFRYAITLGGVAETNAVTAAVATAIQNVAIYEFYRRMAWSED
ncbi:hypothetical protein PROPHIGD12-2_43 [Mycobacterium phage prophiGD12-2]|nr:hypothetical protein PROPHIGD12-2_43 [Mycobacterium phage prophiGD12-2]